jgi:hypothetical protein
MGWIEERRQSRQRWGVVLTRPWRRRTAVVRRVVIGPEQPIVS